MKVYIGWSGPRGKMIGEIFAEMLPDIIQSCEPFFSPEIEKGLDWVTKLTEELRDSPVGIICLTPENLNEPWILFEAGALSKGMKDKHVCTFLYELDSSDVKKPLSLFQYTKNTKEEILRLMGTINKCTEKPLSNDRLEKYFEKWWDEFESRLKKIPTFKEITGTDLPPEREEKDILKEVLSTVRELKREQAIDVPRGKMLSLEEYVNTLPLYGEIIEIEPELAGRIHEQLMANEKLKINTARIGRTNREIRITFYEKPTKNIINKILAIEGVKAFKSSADSFFI